jgi:hypothetical protein
VTFAIRTKEGSKDKRARIRDTGDSAGNGSSATRAATKSALKDGIKRFRALEKLLMRGDVAAGEIDERLLRDLRAAVNRVRNTAWGVQQYIGQKQAGQDPASLLTILAGERVRTTYSLCQAISSDLKKPEIAFQAGSLVELQDAIRKLEADVATALKGFRFEKH